MKKYAYFPGCSLEKMAVSYHKSSLETTQALGVELEELEDWNCCGATTYFHLDEILANTLVARNLAMAEKEGLDFVAPCSACYKNAYFTNSYMQEDEDLAEHINFALEADDLQLSGDIKVHHLIDIFADDIGPETIKDKVTTPLEGLKIAPYYGCQIVRPRKNGEEVENPQFFEEILEAMGADAVDFAYKTRCCGGSLLLTNRKAALDMIHILLQNITNSGAEVVATACPLCQVNLEVYQTQVNEEFGTDYAIPVLYFTQLMGLALGIAPKKLGIGSELVETLPLLSQFIEKEVS
ncbi:MAG: CoB--CoM heterodisulfide reductase iron-sulfur subunit B family protein [Anaerolineae bacterium]|jgi:heterodisulfide reductase subunit B|nr:CoB--CoM heterodisulfide reductase iron-sulfur subunit B family protein [Anaerolineae bacterium]MBT3714076.1 CoB--CoM heterodisulfide reductase iron-sulfur subunit B family protein [Anaerolineae bacterium]MBT4312311.1 CoB--CoM heterodisulfide reductase iron-sulfur subunit B family protein [Anaerolineae bacterium]MBT4457375.1 CoB--CoM heterodisulfide reductase iron-sulfur subunit B family protein [Anaerolineae bacterium]MBT4842917.1 CoB--CoM heterodisulfide reductase iron-sulfur subunit B fam